MIISNSLSRIALLILFISAFSIVPAAAISQTTLTTQNAVQIYAADNECGEWGYPAADLNLDCRVNMKDWAILAANWMNCSIPNDPNCKDYSSVEAKVVDNPDLSSKNDYYVSNREPLKPSVFVKLPVGAVKPEGWLLTYLQRQRDGMTGHLNEISAWLQKEDNAWLSEDGQGKWGWEEAPYWLKGYANIGYILEDSEMIDEAMVWIEGALNNQRANGDFGPLNYVDGGRDYWANMIMLFCLQSYYEYSGDQRVIDLMTDYFRYQLDDVPDEEMLTGYWQRMRGGDNLYSIYWLYNRTGDQWLLDLAHKIHRNTADWTMDNDLPNWHNVNIAQAFGEPATYYMQTKDTAHLQAAYDNFNIVRERYGQVPGGMFGSDENCRPGYDDPRQAIETCGIVEQMLSDELLMRITGDIFWADHCEEVAFNTYPAAVMPDFRSLRYLTAPNMALSDRHDHSPGIQNSGAFLMMNPLSHRCCQHNHSHGWAYFTEHLWMATPDNGLCAAMYSASNVTAKVGNGTEVTVNESTRYPFEEQIRFTVKTDNPVSFPFYMRIPGWCRNASVSVNGSSLTLPTQPGKYIKIKRIWNNGDTVTLDLPMQIETRKWTENHNSVSVDYGPLTFSLEIDEEYIRFDSTETALHDSQWQPDLDTSKWPAYEIHPNSPWNYGLVLNSENPEDSFTIVRKSWPENDFPFTPDSAPIEMRTTARQIPNWKLDENDLVAELQDSPVKSTEPNEAVDLIPMGAARLRISSFPVIGEGDNANQWTAPPEPLPYNPTASHCFQGDTVDALCDQRIPSSSDDHSIPRMTFWDHKGTEEWVQYTFDSPKTVSSVGVYWFDDTGIGECRVPDRWRLLYWDGTDWQNVNTSDNYGRQPDQFNEVSFDEVTTTALRLRIRLQNGYSGGILEWQVN